jgi:hypothetical protein
LKRRELDSCGRKRSLETPQALSAPRRLQDLPAESKFPQRKSTGYNQKQQSLRKQSKKKTVGKLEILRVYLQSGALNMD